MADLAIDLEGLLSLRDSLLIVKNDFEGVERFNREVASYTGDERLAYVVRDFADKWNLRRGFLIDDIEKLSAAVVAIHDTFKELDGQLADNIAKAGNALSSASATPRDSGGGGW